MLLFVVAVVVVVVVALGVRLLNYVMLRSTLSVLCNCC